MCPPCSWKKYTYFYKGPHILLYLSSDFEKKFLKLQDILKVKNYTLIVHDAKIASKVIIGLEEVEVSNVFVEKTEYSKSDEMILILKNKAI